MNRICKIKDCQKSCYARGFCRSHHYRWKKYGNPFAGRVINGEPLKWLFALVDHEGQDCVPWPYGRISGYGSVYYEGRNQITSRLMCRLAHGEPPHEGMDAAHSCGNGHLGCVNPNHLRWATRAENAIEAIEHKSINKGRGPSLAKLSQDDVWDIRKLLSDAPLSQREIGEQFGVSASTISSIANGRTWVWLT